MKEVDINGDGAISLKEFMDYTNSMEFVKPTNTYQMIDDMIEKGEVYTSQELKVSRLPHPYSTENRSIKNELLLTRRNLKNDSRI